MAIEDLTGGSSWTPAASFTWDADYDTVAQTIGLTCTGTGRAVLTVTQSSNGNVLGAIDCGQYQVGGAYTGQRVIVLGPGATGTDINGKALPTSPVPSSVVGAVAPPKGTQPGLFVSLAWSS